MISYDVFILCRTLRKSKCNVHTHDYTSVVHRTMFQKWLGENNTRLWWDWNVFICAKILLLSTEFCGILCNFSVYRRKKHSLSVALYTPWFISWQEHFQGGHFTMLINIIRPLQQITRRNKYNIQQSVHNSSIWYSPHLIYFIVFIINLKSNIENELTGGHSFNRPLTVIIFETIL